VDIFNGDHHRLFTRDRIHQVNNRRGYSVTKRFTFDARFNVSGIRGLGFGQAIKTAK
jgi:hypothetical protein